MTALKRHAPLALLLLSLAFFAIGLLRGESALILQKSIRICLECIGLG